MKRVLVCTLTLALLASVGCTPSQRNPDAIRQDTAKATAEATRDAKAVAEGVVDGLRNKSQPAGKSDSGTVNINDAGPDRLETLPGIDAVRARRIIAHRPYGHADDLVKRRLVTQAEYDRISGQIVAR